MVVTYFDVGFGVLGMYFIKKFFERPSLPLPPGPKPYPLIGNLLDVATGRSWLQYTLFKEKYGPIACLQVLGKHIIILNDLDAAIEIFDKRSAINSDRPRIIFGGEMCGWEDTLALLRDVDRHRRFRKDLHRVIGTKASVSKFHPMIEVEMRRLLYRILKDPSNLLLDVQTSAIAVMLQMTHGYAIQPEGPDPLVEITDLGISQISMAAQPGSFLVDILPFLRYVPEWVPGTGFKQTARYFKDTVTEIVERPFAFVKHQIARGVDVPSYTREELEKVNNSLKDEHIIKWCASSLFTGGSETTVGSIQSFFLAMFLNPEVVKKAQAEIDAVIGSDRLPTFADRENLPYVNAIVMETMRWHPVTPMGLPHVSTQEDVYNGYLLPKGSIILANIYGFSQDPNRYNEPHKFIPERFIGGEAYGGKEADMDLSTFIFGFGRRICPGNNLADATLFMAAALSLAVFDFNLAKDEKGQPIVPKFEYVPGTLTHPEPFPSACAPRSAKAAQLINSIQETHPWGSSDPQTLSEIDWKSQVNKY